MNAFYEHHKHSIRFGHRCFDRILLNGLTQPFQQPREWSGFSIPIGSSIRSVETCCVAAPG
jgi:hypothetical protein